MTKGLSTRATERHFFRFFKMESVLYLTFFLYLCSRFQDFAINSARNSSSDLFPNQRGL